MKTYHLVRPAAVLALALCAVAAARADTLSAPDPDAAAPVGALTLEPSGPALPRFLRLPRRVFTPPVDDGYDGRISDSFLENSFRDTAPARTVAAAPVPAAIAVTVPPASDAAPLPATAPAAGAIDAGRAPALASLVPTAIPASSLDGNTAPAAVNGSALAAPAPAWAQGPAIPGGWEAPARVGFAGWAGPRAAGSVATAAFAVPAGGFAGDARPGISEAVAAPVNTWAAPAPAARPTLQRADATRAALAFQPQVVNQSGTVTYYNNSAAYTAATQNNTTYPFSGAPSGGGVNENGTYTNGPLTFQGSGLYLYNDGSYGSNVTYLEEVGSSEIISLAGASGLSFTLGTLRKSESVAISINGNAVTTVTTTGGAPTTAFIGFTDTVPITSLSFTNLSNSDDIDVISFQVGTSAAVPEPGTWLGGLGLCAAAFGLTHRRRPARLA